MSATAYEASDLMRRSLAYRIYPVYLVIILLAMTVLSFAATRVFRTTLLAEKRGELETIAKLVINALPDGGIHDQAEIIRLTNGTRERVTVIARDGTVVAETDSDPAALENHHDRPEFIAAMRDGRSSAIRFSATTGENTLYVALAAHDSDGTSLGVVRVATSVKRLNLLAREVLVAIATAAAVILVATALTTVIVVNRIHRPLRAIQLAAARYSRGELDYRVSIEKPEEVAAVAEALNSMAGQLSETIARISDQRNELEAVLTSMVEGVIVVDRDRRVRSMNDAARRLFGVVHGDYRGKSLIEHLRNSDLEAFTEDVLTTGTTSERTITLYQPQPVYVQVHGTVLRRAESGGVTQSPEGVLLVLNDITRLKRLEEMRRDFVANVSHELKTPVTSILGFVETLREGMPDDPERAARFLEIVSVHANRLNLIIEDLLSLSRLESHEGPLPAAKCEVEVIVNRVFQACEEQAKNRRITLRDTYSGDLVVWGSENLLEQALVNLVNNAIKYSGEGSTVEVITRNRPGELIIAVKDTGMGIPPSDLSRVFERFYRVDRARSRELGGTGLGLAIVKHIALVHGGEVAVESIEDIGSTFTFRIPQPS